jgi:hypothetical protein
LQALADHAGLIGWDVSVDSTIMRAHQHAAGARRCGGQQAEPPGGVSVEPDDHALGRSRGGWTTKLHLACEQGYKRGPGARDVDRHCQRLAFSGPKIFGRRIQLRRRLRLTHRRIR